MQKILIFGILILFVMSSFVVAENVDSQPTLEELKAEAGTLPDSPFYSMKLVIEDLNMAFTLDAQRKASKTLDLANKRLLEMEIMLKEGKSKGFEKASKSHEELLAQFEDDILTLEAFQTSSESKLILSETFKSQIRSHEKRVSSLEQTASVRQDKYESGDSANIDSSIKSVTKNTNQVKSRIESDNAQLKSFVVKESTDSSKSIVGISSSVKSDKDKKKDSSKAIGDAKKRIKSAESDFEDKQYDVCYEICMEDRFEQFCEKKCKDTDAYFNLITGNMVASLGEPVILTNWTRVSCYDSDGGKKEYSKGMATATRSDESTLTYTDVCSEVTMLKEAYCEDKNVQFEYMPCPNGCNNGVCLTKTVTESVPPPDPNPVFACTDADGGKDEFNPSYARIDDGMNYHRDYIDRCVGTYLYEAYCLNGSIATYQYMSCDEGCEAGACLRGSNLSTGFYCNDYDGGLDETIFSRAERIDSESGAVLNVQFDTCMPNNVLAEAYCDGNIVASEPITCEDACFNGACVVADEPKDSITCTDTDGGLNYDEKGYVKDYLDKKEFSDYCTLNGAEVYSCTSSFEKCGLIEKECTDYNRRSGHYIFGDEFWGECPDGCVDGACVVADDPEDMVTCIDSDGGKKEFIFGRVTRSDKSGNLPAIYDQVDYCKDSVLKEAYCDENKDVKTEIINCDYGCDGYSACLSSPKGDEPADQKRTLKLSFDESLISDECIAPNRVDATPVYQSDAVKGNSLNSLSAAESFSYLCKDIFEETSGTVQMWVSLDSMDSQGLLFGTDDNAYTLAIKDGELVGFYSDYHSSYKNTPLVATIDWAPNSWHLVTFTWELDGPDGDGIGYLYVDNEIAAVGNLIASDGCAVIYVGTGKIYEMNSRTAFSLTDAKIDNFELFNYAISQEEVASTFNSPEAYAGNCGDNEDDYTSLCGNTKKVKMCHNPGMNQQTLEISYNAVEAHINQGDICGECNPIDPLEPSEVFSLSFDGTMDSNEGVAPIKVLGNFEFSDFAVSGTSLSAVTGSNYAEYSCEGIFNPDEGTVVAWVAFDTFDNGDAVIWQTDDSSYVMYYDRGSSNGYKAMGGRAGGESSTRYDIKHYFDKRDWPAELNEPNTWDTEEWHCVALTWDADRSKTKLYIDGELDVEGVFSEPDDCTSFRIGNNFWPGLSWDAGYMDDFKLFKETKSASEINKICTGTADDDDDEDKDEIDDYTCGTDKKVNICHHPGEHQVSLKVSLNAVRAHLAHGDYCGVCQPLDDDSDDETDDGSDDETDDETDDIVDEDDVIVLDEKEYQLLESEKLLDSAKSYLNEAEDSHKFGDYDYVFDAIEITNSLLDDFFDSLAEI